MLPLRVSHLMLQPGALIEYPNGQALNFQSTVPHSDTKGQAGWDKSPIAGTTSSWTSISEQSFLPFSFMEQMEAEGEKKIPALGWDRSGQGRFQTHQVERHKGTAKGVGGPTAALPE